MKKSLFLLLLILIVGCTVVTLLINRESINTHSWNISNLEIVEVSGTCKRIGFEDAVHLEASIKGSANRISEKKLRDMEQDIFTLTGNGATYYQFDGCFSFSEIDELQGRLTTLIVCVASSDPYIYTIRDPITEVSCPYDNVNWTQLDSVGIVDTDKISARLSAMGYITVSDGDALYPERLSNTVIPVFTFSIKEVVGGDLHDIDMTA